MTPATNGAAPRRWVGVGHGAGADAARAGREAAISALEGRDAALVIVFSSTAQDPAA